MEKLSGIKQFVRDRLFQLRRLSGLTQNDLSRLTGIGTKSLSSWETGARVGSLKMDQLARICGAHGVTLAEFFSGQDVPRRAPRSYPPAKAVEVLEVAPVRTIPCRIVPSEVMRDCVSIRADEIGSTAKTLRLRLAEAGFRAGDRAMIVAVRS